MLDCLQFSDKGQIVARNEEIRAKTIFALCSQAEEATKRLEQLRNNLAHAQDILATDWDTIVQLCEFVEQREEIRRDMLRHTQIAIPDLVGSRMAPWTGWAPTLPSPGIALPRSS